MRAIAPEPVAVGIQGVCTALLTLLTANCASVPVPVQPSAGSELSAANQSAALAPLTALEQEQCSKIATEQVFREALAQDRYSVLAQVPVYYRLNGTLPRTCKVEIFDYTKNIDLQATVNLEARKVVGSRQLQDVQPAIGPSEIALARSIAESGPETRARFSRLLLRPLERFEITSMIRTDGQQCRNHRCVEIDYYDTGPTAGTTAAAEPTSAQVEWRPTHRLARVIVDLTLIGVVALEFF